jgi:hypothetical protein
MVREPEGTLVATEAPVRGDLDSLTAPQLLALYVRLLDAMRTRGMIHSGKVVGEYAEALVCRALGLEAAPGGTEGYDALDPQNGERYQIKARRLTAKARDAGMGPFRGLDQAPFDWFVGVVLDNDFHVVRVIKVPHAVVVAVARLVAYDGSHRITVGPHLLRRSDVTDVTGLVQRAALDWA